MQNIGSILLCIFIFVLLSCQQQQGNYTTVSHAGAYIIGAWKVSSEKNAKEVVTGVLNRIRTSSEMNPSITQEDDIQQQQKTVSIDKSSKSEAYRPLQFTTSTSPENLIPQNGDTTDWVHAGKISTYNIETLYKDRFVSPKVYYSPKVFYNYGFQTQAEVEYQSPKHRSVPLILVEIFDMGTPENAFGIYSVSSYPNADFEWIGCKAIISGNYVRFWKGKYFIQIEGYEFATPIRNGMIALAQAVAKKIQDPPQKIPLFKQLPVPYIDGSEKFFANNWSLRNINKSLPSIIPQLTDRTLGVYARYYNSKPKDTMTTYTVFLFRFPSTKEAESAYIKYRTTLMSDNVSFKTDSQTGAILINEQKVVK